MKLDSFNNRKHHVSLYNVRYNTHQRGTQCNLPDDGHTRLQHVTAKTHTSVANIPILCCHGGSHCSFSQPTEYKHSNVLTRLWTKITVERGYNYIG
jgi:hypothetical protein